MRPVTFGTDGIRGVAGDHPITVEVAQAVGRAACRLARSTGGRRVVLGRDPRPTGEALALAVGDGVRQGGGDWLDAGIVPTSAVGLAVHQGLAEVGVVVTASHNAEADNGFKILGAGGRKLDDAAALAVAAWLEEPPTELDGGSRTDVGFEVSDLWRRQLQSAAGDLAALRGKRFAVDLANGAAGIAQSWLAAWLDAEVHLVGVSGGINDGCGSEHLDHLQRVVVEAGCDGGFALDGDADRCRVVDGDGHVVPGDAVIWLLARHLAVTGLAASVMSNGALERGLPDVRVVRTPVGDRHLRSAMDEHDLALGGEESGHVLFADFAAGDGLLTGVRTLVAALSSAPSLAEAFAAFTPLPRRTGKVEVQERRPLSTLQDLQAVRIGAEGDLGPEGRVFLRYSGTEPVLRILVEGASAAAVEAAYTAVRTTAVRILG